MKKIFLLLIMMVVMIAFGLSACGGGETEEAEPTEESAENSTESTQAGSDILVVYFSAT